MNTEGLSAEERQSFLAAAARTKAAALRHLRAARDVYQTIHFIAHLQTAVDGVTQAAAARGVKSDCRAGCSHCCSAPVEALPAEVFAVARALQGQGAEEHTRLIARLQHHAQLTQEGAHIDRTVDCPFLEDQLCSIYALRPATCRKAHSLDVRQCRKLGADIPQDLDTVLRADALSNGTADAYRELGLQATGHAFAPAVLRALADASIESRWLAGEAVFS